MPRAKKRTTRKTAKRRTVKHEHHSHILYGCLAVLGGVVVGVVLFGLLMK